MITIVIAALLGGADASAATIHNFIQCLRQTESEAKSQNVPPDGFVAFARQHCGSAEAPYKSALTSDDVQHGMSHKAAESDAASVINGYYSDRLDDYKVGYKPAAPQPKEVAEQSKANSAPAAQLQPTPASQPK